MLQLHTFDALPISATEQRYSYVRIITAIALLAALPANAQGLSGTQLTFGLKSYETGDAQASTVELRGATARQFGNGVSLQFDFGFFGNDESIGGLDDTDGFKNLRLLTAWAVSDALTLGASASYIKIEREETDSLGMHLMWNDGATQIEAVVEAFEAPTDTASYIGVDFETPLAEAADLAAFGSVDWIDGAGLDRQRAEIGVRRSFSDRWSMGASLAHDDQYEHTNELRVGAEYIFASGRNAYAYVGAGEDSNSAGMGLQYAFGGARQDPLFDLSLFSAAFR